MLAEEPNDAFLHYGLAMEYVSDGDDEEAVRRFLHLFEVAPDYVPGYLQTGQALMRLGRMAEARGIYERGIAIARRQGDQHAAEEMQGFLEGIG
jgi:Tfp pilus assembly protein PilF